MPPTVICEDYNALVVCLNETLSQLQLLLPRVFSFEFRPNYYKKLPWYPTPWHKYYYMSKQDPEIIKEVIESFKKGETVSQMVIRLDMWPDSIKRILVNAGLYLNSKDRKRIAWNKGIPSSKKKDKILIIESGEYRDYTSDATIRKRMREYRVAKLGHKCEICSNTHWQGSLIPLVCDHIDGNADNIEPENFRNICCNCDALLPTYKGRNKGNGRTYRKKWRLHPDLNRENASLQKKSCTIEA